MSPRLPRITAKELVRFLKANSFVPFDQKGSHLHLVNPKTQQKVTVPMHSGQIIGPGLLKSILRQAGLEWA